tara:strand:- start:14828 stop:14980 length:153 start_codon:yes stop_codon:yes gene_type:complete
MEALYAPFERYNNSHFISFISGVNTTVRGLTTFLKHLARTLSKTPLELAS